MVFGETPQLIENKTVKCVLADWLKGSGLWLSFPQQTQKLDVLALFQMNTLDWMLSVITGSDKLKKKKFLSTHRNLQ